MKTGLKVAGHRGTWYAIDKKRVGHKWFYLLESERYGDDAAAIIVDKDCKLVVDDVYNGFDDEVLQYIKDEIASAGE